MNYTLTRLHEPTLMFGYNQATEDPRDGLHVGRATVEMDRQNHFRPSRDSRLDLPRVDAWCVGFDIDQHYSRAEQPNGVCRCNPAAVRNDDLITGADAGRDERHQERDTPVRGRDNVRHVKQLG